VIAPMRLSELQKRCGGDLIGDDVVFDAVSTDTRTLCANDVYVALSGEQFDGHDYLKQVENKAKAFVVERPYKSKAGQCSQLVVTDSRYALGEIGSFCRDQFESPVIAITGSSGKTSARNMLTAIMRTQGEVCTTVANQNNEIGVPLTLLELKKEQVAAVLELGARHIGDIAYLSKFVKPDVAILLNAGSAHIGEFGGYNAIVKGKGEIYEALGSEGVAVVNIDDPAADIWLESLADKRVITYSVANSSADVYALEMQCRATESRFTLVTHEGRVDVILNAAGEHNVSNALAASSAATVLGVELEDIAQGLSNYVGESGRLSRVELSANLDVIDDSYNANPASMKSALDVLSLDSRYRIAVLGEMGELGDVARREHEELAEYASNKNIEEVWLYGKYAENMAQIIGAKAKVFVSKESIAASLRSIDKLPATVLLKASRFVALEEVLELYQRGCE